MHIQAAAIVRDLAGTQLLTHNYVVVESTALVQRRHGHTAVSRLFDVLSPIEIIWVDEPIHRAAVAAFRQGGADGPSLVDCASFEVMRLRGIDAAFAFDRHFVQQGFELVG